jgi:hypothetical protein
MNLRATKESSHAVWIFRGWEFLWQFCKGPVREHCGCARDISKAPRFRVRREQCDRRTPRHLLFCWAVSQAVRCASAQRLIAAARLGVKKGRGRELISSLPLAAISCQQPISPSHRSPVVLVCRSAEWASLVMAAIGVDARPGKPMRATLSEKPLQEIHYSTPLLRFLHASSHRLKNGLGSLSSRP